MIDYPSYITCPEKSLQRTALELVSLLEDCTVCPHHCHVNRLKGELGYCHAGWHAEISGYGPHSGEESPLVGRYGSGTIFFSHCNMGCVYCQNWDTSHSQGEQVSPEELADIMLDLQSQGCHNINLVSPSHYVPQIIAALVSAANRGLRIPLVYNSGGYDEKAVLEKLNGIIDIYMPDFKYADPTVGKKLSCIDAYTDIAKTAIKEMHRQVGDLVVGDKGIACHGLIIRHLVLPGNLAATDEIMRFIAQEISPYSYINIMDQYYPEFKAGSYPGLNRPISRSEYQAALTAAKKASPHFRLA
ncbi:radical SAM protein [Sporomusa sp.]|uniref:radical SAM protein n=1 Tax=Sporomusa sp. TaxID=2078658 RepID=UPI002BD7A0D2|nr:radical SAM protein [Sporomusa sp.]HWR45650.1 radical SAM protein [Sporomusa sp.]